MHFDVFTALTVSTAVVFLLGIVLTFFWRRRPNGQWLAFWAASYFMIALANALAVIAPEAPRPLAFAAGSGAFMLGFALMWQAARVFEGRRPLWGAMAAIIGSFVALLLIPDITKDVSRRIALVSAPMALCLALAAWETWRGRAEGLPSKIAVATLLAVTALVVGGRIVIGAQAAYPVGSRPVNDLVIAALIGGLIATSILLATFVLSMTLERAEKNQRKLATTDSMTGLLNRRGLEAALGDDQLPGGWALIVFDLDRFKQVNDTFGHAAGDALINAFALICREELRQVDHAARLGGEEFALVLARTDADAAMALAEKVRRRFSQCVVAIDGGAVVGTVSGGVFATRPDEWAWLNAAVACADRALYRAKAAGRDRVFVHDAEDESTQGSRSFDPRFVAPEEQAASA